MKRLLLHGWLFILLMSAALSYTAYVYLGHLNEKFIQSEVDHRSRLLLRDIQEIIQQHLDASRGLSTYAYAELASHGGITETREAKDVLRGMLATHPGEIVRAGIIPEDGKPLIESAGDGERVPRFRVENIPEIHSGQVRLDLVENGVSGLLRVIYTPCLNQRCPRVFADVSLSVLIQRILGRSDTQHLLSGLAIKLDYTGTAEGITLFEHGSLKAATGFHWHGYFDLAGSRFLLTTAASPALVRHLSATTPQWVLALGLILGLMLALLAHDRARFGQRLREQVAMRTAALEEEREKLSAVIDYAAEAILVTDAIGRIQQANPAASRMFGYQPEEWSGLDLQVLVPENLRGQHARWMIEELANGSHGIIGHEREIEVRCKDGSLMPCSVMVSEFTAGGQRHLSVILHDLTERKRHEQQLEFLSFHDELTGLPNRRMFERELEQSLLMQKELSAALAVMYVALDRFRLVNDILGPSAGDHVLREVSRHMQEALGGQALLARLGSSWFGVIVPGADREQASTLAEQLLEGLVKPVPVLDQQISLAAYIGIALYPGDGEEASTLVRHAAAAMARAKKTFDAVCFFSAEIEQQAKRRLLLEQDLTHAIKARELSLHYQTQHRLIPDASATFPLHYQSKRSLDGAGIIGVEALVRWSHPELGMVAPNEFIPLAEETGQIRELTHCVLMQAGRQACLWEQHGIRPERISVNLSAAQLMQRGLAEDIIAVIRDSGAMPEWMEIEITETALMAEPDLAVAMLRKLADAGIVIAIDDFGSGYSSLSYLKLLPAQWLKIDMSFIRELPHNKDDATIVRSTIAMAHALGMKCVAEGVETKEQLEFLRGEGCDAVQGYYFSRPLPADELDEQLRRYLSRDDTSSTA